jgi:hypothetical protein
MDPFIEGEEWKDFHHSILSAIRDVLNPLVLPKYVVRIEESVYLFDEDTPRERTFIEPDVAIIDRGGHSQLQSPRSGNLALKPIPHTVPLPQHVRQAYLVISDRRHRDVVTAIEVLSPWNKTGRGREHYLNKREGILATPANLVEIDLLRRGERLPTVEPLTPADYYVFVCRPEKLPIADVFAWQLLDRLPEIGIPLASGDADVALDLQAVFATVYDLAAYQFSLDYTAEVEPRLGERQQHDVEQLLREAGKI